MAPVRIGTDISGRFCQVSFFVAIDSPFDDF